MNTPRTDRILDNLAVAMTADTREQSKAHSEEACREIEQLETELAAVTDERDALKHALIELESASEAYAADQSRATDSRCGLVQPITVEDGNRLLSALRIANELTK